MPVASSVALVCSKVCSMTDFLSIRTHGPCSSGCKKIKPKTGLVYRFSICWRCFVYCSAQVSSFVVGRSHHAALLGVVDLKYFRLPFLACIPRFQFQILLSILVCHIIGLNGTFMGLVAPQHVSWNSGLPFLGDADSGAARGIKRLFSYVSTPQQTLSASPRITT